MNWLKSFLRLLKRLFESVYTFPKDNSSNDLYKNEEPKELIRKIMSDGWNRFGGTNA